MKKRTKELVAMMSELKDIPYEQAEGAKAFDWGTPLSDNPHPIPTKAAGDWQIGWLEAMRAKEYWEDQTAEFDRIFGDVPFVFWTCTNGCRGRVQWNEERTEAVCLECGRKSTEPGLKDHLERNKIDVNESPAEDA
ncbi:MAG: hypothetical protein ACXADB_12270 [Candidatus Hermodarchaeia archaeon]